MNNKISEDAAEAEKKNKLFEQQKKLLDTFLEHHTITKEQYEFSLNGLIKKMNIR